MGKVVTSLVNIRVGRSADTLIVGQRRPFVSWQLQSSDSNVLQEAYEVQVASTAEFDCNFVTSGIVQSSSVIQAQWPGTSLKSREVRYVRVKAFVNGDWTSWSAVKRVEAGLLAGKDWRAIPIGMPNDPGIDEIAPAPVFRKEFILDSSATQSRLYVSSQGIFSVTINDQPVTDELFNPGWTSYKKRIAYRTYDVSSLLRTGPNAISIVVGDGWFRGQLTWALYRKVFGDHVSALAQMEITTTSGKKVEVITDKNWKVSTCELRAADIYDGVLVDFNKEQIGYQASGFDDSSWVNAEEIEGNFASLFPMTSPPIRVTASISPISHTEDSSGSTIYDFGQNLAGHLRMKIKGKRGDRVTLRHAEVLKDGQLNRALLRRAKAEDIFVLSDERELEITPNFTFHGFRYAEIDTNAEIIDVVAEIVHSDMPRIGNFECSNTMLNKLHSNTLWSQRANFISVPTDCPQRDERLGWTGDAQAFASTASTIYDCEGFLASWMLDLALDQLPDGAVCNYVPYVPAASDFDSPRDFAGGRAGWGDAATIVPWALYEAYGDKETLRDQYDSMVRWVEYLESKSDATDLIPPGEFQFGDWLDPDAPANKPWLAKCDSAYITNAFFAYSARLLGQSAAVLGKEADHQYYMELADRVSASTWKKWQLEIPTTATGCATAIELEIAPESERASIAKSLAKLVDSVNGRISTGFLGTPLVMPALSRYGHFDAAYKLLLNEEVPGWLYQIKRGATSMWERWDALLPDGEIQQGDLDGSSNTMVSFNHYAYGAVTVWMYRNIGGISPMIERPGYEEILFAPNPHPSLTWARASVETRFGLASIEWKEYEGGYKADIEIPAGSIGWFVAPSSSDERIRMGSGSHTVEFK